jgi:hypothetical protein
MKSYFVILWKKRPPASGQGPAATSELGGRDVRLVVQRHEGGELPVEGRAAQ